MDNTLSLHKAVSEADITSITFCLDNGIDINARGVHGETPLHIAANLHPTIDIEDISKITEILVTHGADVNAHNNAQQTPLHMAAKNNQNNIIKYLFKHGADIQALSTGQYNCLHHNAMHIEEISRFIDNPIAPMYMMEQIIDECLHNMKTAVTYGAHIDRQSKHGSQPDHLTSNQKYKAHIEHIRTKNADIPSRIKTESLQNLIDDEIPLPTIFSYADDEQKKELFSHFCIYSYLYHQSKLIQTIAQYTDAIPKCWILYAARCGHKDIAKTLIAQQHIGDNINHIQNKHGNALHIAAAYNRPDIFSILLRVMNPAHTNASGDTACSIAQKKGHEDFCEIIADLGIVNRLLMDASSQYHNCSNAHTEKPEIGKLPIELLERIAHDAVPAKLKK
jgi:ankyrin repeat protein